METASGDEYPASQVVPPGGLASQDPICPGEIPNDSGLGPFLPDFNSFTKMSNPLVKSKISLFVMQFNFLPALENH